MKCSSPFVMCPVVDCPTEKLSKSESDTSVVNNLINQTHEPMIGMRHVFEVHAKLVYPFTINA